jgi:adenylyl-sulfate kinase
MNKGDEKNNKSKGFVLWFTGFSAAGKSSIADAVFDKLSHGDNRIERLDGDVVRKNLTHDLGFSKEDRNENVKRVGFVANLLSKNGVVVVAAFIAPYKKQRDDLKKNVHNFIEIFVDAPLDVCIGRDPKGMYKKAQEGEIKLFTGISDKYEEPDNPDIHLRTDKQSIEECRDQVVEYLRDNNYLKII